MTEALLQIHRRIDDFIARFYKRKAMEGLVLSVISALAGFLIMGVIEYLTWSSSSVRFWLWISYLLVVLGIFAWRVVMPFLQSMGWVTRMDRRTAAMLLTAELPEMRDQLINVLDLGNVKGGELLIAAIEQKSEKLATLSFVKAVRKEQLMRFLKINAAVIAVWALLLLFDFGQALLQSGTRVVNYSTQFERPAPFQWIWENSDVQVKHNDAVELIFDTEGDVAPESGHITMNGQRFPLQRSQGRFVFELPRVKDAIHFSVHAAGVSSKNYTLTPLYYPSIVDIEVEIVPPSYTGLSASVFRSGNVTVPKGSVVKWNVQTRHTGHVLMEADEQRDSLHRDGNRFVFKRQVQDAMDYTLFLQNPDQDIEVNQPYAINVIADRMPELDLEWLTDEGDLDFVSAYGSASDDYGIRVVKLEYNVGDGFKTLEQVAGNARLQVPLRFTINLKDDAFPEGKEIVLRVAATDNDASGAKTTYSSTFTTRKLSRQEREEKRKETISQSGAAVEKFNEERRRQREESQAIIDKRKSGDPMQFKDEEQLKDLMKEQAKSLDETIEALEELQRELEQSDDPQDQEMAERVEEQKSELEKLRDEIRDLLEKNKPEELLKKAEEIQQKMDERQRELKTEQLQMEQMNNTRDMLQSIDELRQMAEELGEMDMDDTESVEKLEEKFEEWEKIADDAMEKFPEMKDKLKEEGFEEKKKEIKDKIKEGKDGDDSKKKDDARDDAKKKMDKMQSEMMDAFMETQQSAAKENMEHLRQLLKNLLVLSFEQEGVSEDASGLRAEASLLKGIVERQQKMQLASEHVIDSLYALAERVPEIDAKVRNEAREMINNMERGKSELQNDKLGKFGGHMKGAMKSSNELALLLDAILQQMMQDMSNDMPGQQNCQKPGDGQPDISELLDEQKGMGEEMGQDEEGSQDGDGAEKGQDQQSGESGESGDDAKEQAEAARRLQMMQRQEQIRRNLSRIMEEKGMGDQGKELEELMEEQERDIILGKSRRELLERQREIEIRLLELESAMRKQDEDDQREAETAEEERIMPRNPHEEYLRKKMEEIERIQRSPFRFTPYYEERRRRLIQ